MNPVDVRLEEIERELADLNEKRSQLRTHWEMEKRLIQETRSKKQEIEQARLDAERLEREGDFGRVAEIRYGQIPNLEKAVSEGQDQLENLQREKQMLKEEV